MYIAGQSGASNNLSKSKNVNFTTLKGDTFFYEYDIYFINETTGEEEAYDFTDCVFMAQVKKRKTDRQAVANLAVSADGNTLTLRLPAEVTRDLEPGTYFYDVEVFEADEDSYTFMHGTIKITQDVTEFQEAIMEYLDIMLQDSHRYQEQGRISLNAFMSDSFTLELKPWLIDRLQSTFRDNYSVLQSHWLLNRLHLSFFDHYSFLGLLESVIHVTFSNQVSFQ